MLTILRHTILDGLRDAKFLFLSTLVIVTFIANGYVYSERHRSQMEDYQAGIAETNRLLEPACSNLQELAVFEQEFKKPPSPLAFLADGGELHLPNVVRLNAFRRWEIGADHAVNERSPLLTPIDWNMIVGSLMTLLAILVSYSAIAGEKRDGTLRQVLAAPVARFKFLLGKYLGLLAVMFISLAAGVLANLLVISLMGGHPIDGTTYWIIVWCLVVSISTISFFLLLGLLVSALAGNPPVALVILLVVWVSLVIVIPGAAGIVSGQIFKVPSDSQIRREIDDKSEEIYHNAPPRATGWTDNPRGSVGKDIQDFRTALNTELQKIEDRYLKTQISQVLLSHYISYFSPAGLLSDSLQNICGTGVYGVRTLVDAAEKYRRQLLQYIINEDAKDDNSPHRVFGFRSSYYGGAFSDKDVSPAAVPKAEALWSEVVASGSRGLPLVQLLYLLMLNVNAGLIATFAMVRIDPR